MYRSHGMRRSPGRLIGAKLSDSNWSKWHNSRKNTSNNTCWWFCQTHSKIWWWHHIFRLRLPATPEGTRTAYSIQYTCTPRRYNTCTHTYFLTCLNGHTPSHTNIYTYTITHTDDTYFFQNRVHWPILHPHVLRHACRPLNFQSPACLLVLRRPNPLSLRPLHVGAWPTLTQMFRMCCCIGIRTYHSSCLAIRICFFVGHLTW